MVGSKEQLYYPTYDIYITDEYGFNNNININRSEEEEDDTDFFDVLLDKVLSVFSPIRKSRKLKKFKKKIKSENVDVNSTTKRLDEIKSIPFFYFGDVESHPIYHLYKYIEMTNHIRDLNFMEQWLINSDLRQRCYQDLCQMSDDYYLKGNKTYDNVRPSYQEKWYNQLKIAVRDFAMPVDFECQCGIIQFPDAIWDVLGCMVFKQFMGNDVNSSLVCHIDHIFPLSRIKGGGSEFQNLCVLNKTVNSVSRKGKHHLFELYEDDKVNNLLNGCIRRSHLVAYFNSKIRKNINKQTAGFKKALEDTTRSFLTSNGVQAAHIESIQAVPNTSTNIHVIHVKFNSSGK